MSIKLLNASLDVVVIKGKESLVVRGVLDFADFDKLQVDSYQREIGSSTKIGRLAEALENSKVPDIELGMRGEKIRDVKDDKGGSRTIYLQDDVYIIDGLQRISGGRLLMQRKPGSAPRIGCVVHIGTTFDWERERFRILNQERSKLGVNVLLRNACPDYESIDMLFKLCDDTSFTLHRRVCWSQAKSRDEIVTALLLAKTVGVLHSRFGPGRGTSYQEIGLGLNKIMGAGVGRNTMRDNTKQFFEFLDRCFSIRRIVFSQGAPQIRGTFLTSFADVITRHDDFWDGNKFRLTRDLERKISLFPINDPEIARLSGSNGKAKEMLVMLIIEHINSGKRTRRLTLSAGFASATSQEAGDENSSDES